MLTRFVDLKRLVLAGGLLTAATSSYSAPVESFNLIPKPSLVEAGLGQFVVNPDTCIYSSEALLSSARFLREVLEPATSYTFPASVEERDNCINFQVNPELDTESYTLDVNNQSVLITAADAAGAFYAVQSLRQLLPSEVYATTAQDVEWTLPAIKVADEPRFGWRGMHLDVGRHYMPVAFIKKFIDSMAAHKLNTFHWHLTEDQGWRIEIKQYPKLTEAGAWRDASQISPLFDDVVLDEKRHGGYYTQDEVREIVAYAAERHITIVPEIELPGHAQAAIAAYPELGNTGEQVDVRQTWGISKYTYSIEDSTFEFLENVLTEVMDLFPGQYIHVGGDEAPKDQWKESPAAQAKIKELGLKDERALQSWFIGRINTFLQKHDRKLVGWDEIMQGGLVDGATVMSWRGESGGVKAAKAGHDVVMSSVHCFYFDMYQASRDKEPLAQSMVLRLEDVYSCDPIPSSLKGEQKDRILGAQGQLWTEFVPTPEHAEYMIYPRLSALSEVVWSQPEQKDYNDFQHRMQIHTERLDQMGINYRPLGNDELSFWGGIKLSMAKAALNVYFWIVE